MKIAACARKVAVTIGHLPPLLQYFYERREESALIRSYVSVYTRERGRKEISLERRCHISLNWCTSLSRSPVNSRAPLSHSWFPRDWIAGASRGMTGQIPRGKQSVNNDPTFEHADFWYRHCGIFPCRFYDAFEHFFVILMVTTDSLLESRSVFLEEKF